MTVGLEGVLVVKEVLNLSTLLLLCNLTGPSSLSLPLEYSSHHPLPVASLEAYKAL